MTNILFVEDDDIVRENFSTHLRQNGFEVDAFSDAKSAIQQFEISQPNLAILDIALGNETDGGFHLCTELRKRSEKLPIIFYTGLDSDIDKISGMRLGADDYLTKDMNIDYLIVRIKALLRRIDILTNNNQIQTNELIRGDLSINLDTLYAKWKNTQLDLSLTQTWILHSLASNPGHVRSHQQLMDAANLTIQPNTIAVHIKNIREQLQNIDSNFSCIKTERGIGYRWLCH